MITGPWNLLASGLGLFLTGIVDCQSSMVHRFALLFPSGHIDAHRGTAVVDDPALHCVGE